MYGFEVGEKVMVECDDGEMIGPFTIRAFNSKSGYSDYPHVEFIKDGWQGIKELRKIPPYQLQFDFMKEV